MSEVTLDSMQDRSKFGPWPLPEVGVTQQVCFFHLLQSSPENPSCFERQENADRLGGKKSHSPFAGAWMTRTSQGSKKNTGRKTAGLESSHDSPRAPPCHNSHLESNQRHQTRYSHTSENKRLRYAMWIGLHAEKYNHIRPV